MRTIAHQDHKPAGQQLAKCGKVRHHAVVTPNRKRLGAAVHQRRVDLDITSRRALAEAAKIGKRTVDSVETGERVSVTSMYKIERALGWVPGSMEDILNGGDPTPLDNHQQETVDLDDLAATAEEWIKRGQELYDQLERYKQQQRGS